jgi:hypothetical protein
MRQAFLTLLLNREAVGVETGYFLGYRVMGRVRGVVHAEMLLPVSEYLIGVKHLLPSSEWLAM